MREPKLTIAQLRWREVKNLAARGLDTPEKNLEKAEYLMNSFYRFVGLNERIAYMENDEYTYTRRRKYIEHENERIDRWIKRLNKGFADFGLKLVSPGLYPIICDSTGHRVIYTYYYD